jgi:acetone carboxylase alpha subunit
MGGWGDVLERDLSLVERDVHYGWIIPDVARSIYGVVTDKDGKVKAKETEDLRQKMRLRRKERSIDAKDWWKKEREQVLRKDFSEDVYNMYADCLKYPKFRREFMGMWQLPEDYRL